MKILGIGVDIIQNKRIKASIKNHKFKDRIFSSKELELSNYSNMTNLCFSKMDMSNKSINVDFWKTRKWRPGVLDCQGLFNMDCTVHIP